jgi:endonuclease YncB( thermonuclease family)
MNACPALILGCLFACANAPVADELREITGRVVRVIDGDTVELATQTDSAMKIRLSQIDAPEKAQPYGDRATSALSDLALGKTVRVQVVDVDRYGRTVGEVWVGDLHVNFEMVRRGHAWAYTRYVKSLEVIDLEDEARREKRGLWTLPIEQRDSPWVWRKERRRGAAGSAVWGAGVADRVCGEKRTCKEMVSCAEARFYLVECGLGRLDRDGDGVPCESRCGS